MRSLILIWLLCMVSASADAQCFASAGNPIGGTENMGTMDRNSLRISTFYRFLYSDRYYEGYQRYKGEKGILRRADYNYLGLMIGYGIVPQLTAEIETGYYINKTQLYKIGDKLTGRGLSNLVVSLKPRLYYHSDKRWEITTGLGAIIPFTQKMKESDGVTLPIDIQPTTGSYGLAFQFYVIKENSFKGIRFFLVNRIEKYFLNRHYLNTDEHFLFGTIYSNSFFFSRHFVFEGKKIKDWTLILQIKNQIKEKNVREGQKVAASGGYQFYLVPQINASLGDHWNVSLLGDIPFFQHYNEIQLANKFSLALSVSVDLKFKNKKKS